jgi:hypothetical protein
MFCYSYTRDGCYDKTQQGLVVFGAGTVHARNHEEEHSEAARVSKQSTETVSQPLRVHDEAFD